MTERVLVTFATKFGATREIAERIGTVLGASGIPTDVRPVNEVADLAGHDAVVVGSAVYAGRWRKEAVTFLETFERDLAQRPLWVFSSGPTGHGDPVALVKGWRFPEAQASLLQRIAPRDTAVFHGAIDASKLSLIEKAMIRTVKAPTGDFRDWSSIEQWAATIAEALRPTADGESR
jgi:menaquinone-dependent protoporphyrinogen oxidase